MVCVLRIRLNLLREKLILNNSLESLGILNIYSYVLSFLLKYLYSFSFDIFRRCNILFPLFFTLFNNLSRKVDIQFGNKNLITLTLIG